MSKVFVSYKRDEDKDKVLHIVNDMESKLGIKFWMDLVGIESSDQFPMRLINAIDECEVFLFMYSKAHENIDSVYDWTVKEITYAHEIRKRIVWIELEECKLHKWFLFNFPYKQVVKANDESAMKKLTEDIREWLHLPQPNPSPNNQEKTIDTKDIHIRMPNRQSETSETQSNVVKGHRNRNEWGNRLLEERGEFYIETVDGVAFKMIHVEGGTFIMGSNEEDADAFEDELPAHQVTLSSYYICETTVTQALWKAVMKDVENPSIFKGDNHPVENVSWDECQDFIRKLNEKTNRSYRLPTEAEWEYAARGGNKSKNFKYAGSDIIDDVAWYEHKTGRGTHPVALLQPNELGLYDMSGNVWEWCQDWYGEYNSVSQNNPQGPESGEFRMNRGGSWRSFHRGCRIAYRLNFTRKPKYFALGFRLAL